MDICLKVNKRLLIAETIIETPHYWIYLFSDHGVIFVVGIICVSQ
jgi:hypothetical protein